MDHNEGQGYLYYLIYKPCGINSQFSDQNSLKEIEGLNGIAKNVYPIGRLDKDSEGLLLLTSDPSMNKTIIGKSNKFEKEYWVQVEGEITVEALEQLRGGIAIKLPDGEVYNTEPAYLSIFEKEPVLPQRNPPIRYRKSVPTSWIKLVIREGKNHQVRKMTSAVGFPTLRLVRVRIGPFTLPTPLRSGMVSKITPAKFLALVQEAKTNPSSRK
jgi:23S rRNA pseudouridine2457 synthase